MNDKQQRRAEILRRLSANEVTTQQACALLGVTDRHLRRTLKRFRSEGLGSLVHANTGRIPSNKTPTAITEELAVLAGKGGAYHDFNTSHMQELLAERDHIEIGRSTLDRLLRQSGVRKRKGVRERRVFGRRERMAREGEMLLIDASLHDWLEGRDPGYKRFCLLGAVDDATGGLKHLRFWPTECQAGYILMAREVTVTFGIPTSFYHDRHTILTSPKEQTIDDELAGREPTSQFQAILSQLGAEGIKARTPQAKGRIERIWKTLQDRLIKEMRLAGVGAMEDANAFLPAFIDRYNTRFSVPARDCDPAWVHAADLDLPFYFAAKKERTVRADHTISVGGKTLLIKRSRGERSIAGERVQVHTTPEDESFVYWSRIRLQYTKLEAQPPRPPSPAKQPQMPEDQKTRRNTLARRRQMAYLHTKQTT